MAPEVIAPLCSCASSSVTPSWPAWPGHAAPPLMKRTTLGAPAARSSATRDSGIDDHAASAPSSARATSARPSDAVLVMPLDLRMPAWPAAQYEKTAEVVEALRAAGALVIDASEQDGAAVAVGRARAELAARVGHEPRVARLRGRVSRRHM